MQSIMHGSWKEYRSFSVNFLMPTETDLRDSTTRPYLYVPAFGRFYIIKKLYKYYECFFFCL